LHIVRWISLFLSNAAAAAALCFAAEAADYNGKEHLKRAIGSRNCGALRFLTLVRNNLPALATGDAMDVDGPRHYFSGWRVTFRERSAALLQREIGPQDIPALDRLRQTTKDCGRKRWQIPTPARQK